MPPGPAELEWRPGREDPHGRHETAPAMNRSAVPAPGRAPEPPEEGLLLEGLRARNEAAFDRLVRAYGGRMLAVARRFLRNEEDARDVVQDAFVSAFRSIDRFAGDSRVSTWLHRIVVNASLMRLRSRRRGSEEPIDDLLPRFLDDGHEVRPTREWREDAQAALERREVREQVRRCIDRLPDTYRTVLLMRDIEEMDTEVVAHLLEISPNAVKIRLHRARQALRTLLDPQFRKGAR